MKKSAAFCTLGCKVNAYETEAMKEQLIRAGFEIRDFTERADIYVVNTCSVTNIADRKSRQMLHRAHELNPDAIVAAVGCYAQGAAEVLRKDPAVDLVLGNEEKNHLAEALLVFLENGKTDEGGARVAVSDIASMRCYNTTSAGNMPDYTRAFLKIQDGCNQFCTYCIIPFVRGRARSRVPEDIRREAEEFASKGYRELVLTGIHLSAYGTDLVRNEAASDAPDMTDAACTESERGKTAGNGSAETSRRKEEPTLSSVVCMLDKIPGIERIRISSLEPEIITTPFIEALTSARHFCPHFHLSLQSGSDTVLRRMNRHYTAEQFLTGVEEIRKYFPNAAITTDVIVGFPGETEQEFEETCAFVKRAAFYELHIFPYSRRAGTKAASMPGQLTRAEKAARVEKLSGIGRALSRSFREKQIGHRTEILTEETWKRDGRTYLTGFTREYVRAAVALDDTKDAEDTEDAGNAANRLVRGVARGFLDEETLLLEETNDK